MQIAEVRLQIGLRIAAVPTVPSPIGTLQSELCDAIVSLDRHHIELFVMELEVGFHRHILPE